MTCRRTLLDEHRLTLTHRRPVARAPRIRCATDQSVVPGECRRGVLGPKTPALLQDRDHTVDEVGEPARQVGRHDVEAVRGPGIDPTDQVVGELFRCPGKGAVPAPSAESPDELADGQVLAQRKCAHQAGAALVALDVGLCGQRW